MFWKNKTRVVQISIATVKTRIFIPTIIWKMFQFFIYFCFKNAVVSLVGSLDCWLKNLVEVEFRLFFGGKDFVWYVLEKQNSRCPNLNCNGQNKNFYSNNYLKNVPIFYLFLLQKRSCFPCRFTWLLIKKFSGGGISFIFWGKGLCLICFGKTKLALSKSQLQRSKQEFLFQQLSEKCSNFLSFFASKTQLFPL